jgi:hypothetical protein
MRIFRQHCGQCPKWTATEFHDKPGRQVLGMCAKYNQARHSQRELCKPEWDREIRRLAKSVGAKDSQIKIMVKEPAILDPKRTMEALGYSFEVKTQKTQKEKSTKRA